MTNPNPTEDKDYITIQTTIAINGVERDMYRQHPHEGNGGEFAKKAILSIDGELWEFSYKTTFNRQRIDV